MNVKELRIGNWLEGSYNGFFKPIQVYSFDNDKILHTDEKQIPLPIKNFKSIPLTEEWLLKFGLQKNGIIFEKEKNSKFAIKKWQIGINIEWCIFWGENILREVEIKYVHQLQNLYFALTQNELELINESAG